MATVARLTPRSVSIVSWRGNDDGGGGRTREKERERERERGTRGSGGGNVERVEERGVREVGGRKGDRATLGAGRSGRARAIQPPFTFNKRARSLARLLARRFMQTLRRYENRQRCRFRPALPSPLCSTASPLLPPSCGRDSVQRLPDLLDPQREGWRRDACSSSWCLTLRCWNDERVRDLSAGLWMIRYFIGSPMRLWNLDEDST